MLGLCICLPFAFIKNVQPFVYFTVACLCIIFVSVLTIAGYMAEIINLQGFNHTSSSFNWGNFPMFFGMACFSLEGIGLIFPIRGSLKEPNHFTKLFVIVASCAVLLYMIFGTISNLALGNSVMPIIFHNFPKNYSIIFVLQFAYALGIFTTFPLYIQACINTVKKISLFKCLYEGKKENIMTTISRAVLIMMIF